jgi:manganese-dependent inorganic pyrophosphatase
MPPKTPAARTGAGARTSSWPQMLLATAVGAAAAFAACWGTALPAGVGAPASEPELRGSIFVGHLAADLDSVAAAVAAAELHGGTAAVASVLNSESRWALGRWGATAPVPVEDAIAAQDRAGGEARVCLVDFQQTTQLHPAVQLQSIVGVIDHHALQSKTIVTKKPISVNIRPWGCTCTILGADYASRGRTPSRPTAGLMLSAVLSDTLNLRSPTTTVKDRELVRKLAKQLGVDSVDAVAAELFEAKSAELASLPARSLVEGDMKIFSPGESSDGSPIAIAVVETTSTGPVLSRIDELQGAIRSVKKEHSLSVLLLAVVDIVRLGTQLVLADADDVSLASAAFPHGKHADGYPEGVLEIGPLVSRKLDLVPPVQRAFKVGGRRASCVHVDAWCCHAESSKC